MPRMHARDILIEPLEYLAPARAVDGLTSEEAERRAQGAPHSIAEILAHLTFWQDWFCQRCAGISAPVVGRAADGWPAVPSGSWPDLHQRFLAGLQRAAAFADCDAPITPPIDFPPLAAYTIRDAQVHMAIHNAHHLGQIILLRQMLGLWPPPGGSWTW